MSINRKMDSEQHLDFEMLSEEMQMSFENVLNQIMDDETAQICELISCHYDEERYLNFLKQFNNWLLI